MPPRQHHRPPTCALLACLASACAADEPSSGKYIVFSARSDAPLCADLVDDLDTFVEQVADYLAVDPPPDLSIDYTWIPLSSQEALPCSDATAYGCAARHADRVQTFARTPGHTHELVHAVHQLMLPRTLPVLDEGLADYLGSVDGDYLQDRSEFTARFRELLANDRTIGNAEYTLAMQFVGATIERGGREKFLALRIAATDATTFAIFAEAYESIYAEPLADALAAIESMEVRPIFPTYRTTCQGVPLAWPAAGVQTWTLQQDDACLDRFGINTPGPSDTIYNVRYTATPPVAGTYQLIRPDHDGSISVYIRRCGAPPDERAWINSDGLLIDLEADTYILEVVSVDLDLVLRPIELGVVTP